MTAHEELLDRLRKATTGSRELSLAIPPAFGFVWNGRLIASNPEGRWQHQDGRTLPDLAFSESIDAALRLVPDGLYWVLGYGRTRETEPLAACGLIKPGSDEPFIAEEANTVALAICIAAISAHSLTPATEPERE